MPVTFIKTTFTNIYEKLGWAWKLNVLYGIWQLKATDMLGDETIVRKAKLADRPSIEMLCKEQNGRLCNKLVIKYRTVE